jgi:CubicO group peptidase (beta-lactamase class C family)
MRRLMLLVGIVLILAQVLCAQSAESRAQALYEEGGQGWELASLDMDVVVDPRQGRIINTGRARLRLRADSSRGPNLELPRGETVFEKVDAPEGATVAFNQSAASASIRFEKTLTTGAEIVLSFRCRNLQAIVGRSIAVGTEGAFASWGGSWYPSTAWEQNGQPDRFVPGQTRLTVPAEWQTLSTGRLTESIVKGNTRTETWFARQRAGRSFIAGPYVVSRQQVGAVEVGIYLSKEHAGKSRMYAAAVPPMVKILERHFGPYPFDSFAIAEVPAALAPPGFGGRSEPGYFLAHTNVFDSDAVDVHTFAHELTHMIFLEVGVEGTKGMRVQTVELSTAESTFILESAGKPTGVRLDPQHKLLLWQPEFGPITGVTATFTAEQWHVWLDKEIAWLRDVYDVPGSSVAVMDGFRVEWSKGYGVASVNGEEPVDDRTLFQAGELSHPVAALAALMLVKRGVLDMDGEVNARLRSWKLPESAQTSREKVTLRRLLSHTAGLNVASFRGYEPGDARPTLLQILDGRAPANSTAIRVEAVPGTAYRYSDGGYAVVQQLLVDTSGRPFDELARELIFAPLGIERSTFAQPLPSTLRASAASGQPLERRSGAGGWRVYPAQAATGLWTNAADLSRFMVEIMKAAAGKPDARLDQQTVREMLNPVAEVRNDYFGAAQIGLGFYLNTQAGQPTRVHYQGFTSGYSAFVIAFPEKGQGCVVLTSNGHRGLSFAVELAQRIGIQKGWSSVPRWGG